MNNPEIVSGNNPSKSQNQKNINDQRLSADGISDVSENENESNEKSFDSDNNDLEVDTTRVDQNEIDLDRSGPSESYDLGQKHMGSAAPTSTGGAGGAKPEQTVVGSVDKGEEIRRTAEGSNDVSKEVKKGTGAPRNTNTNRGTQDNDLRH